MYMYIYARTHTHARMHAHAHTQNVPLSYNDNSRMKRTGEIRVLSFLCKKKHTHTYRRRATLNSFDDVRRHRLGLGGGWGLLLDVPKFCDHGSHRRENR